jgi:hypothetical protein
LLPIDVSAGEIITSSREMRAAVDMARANARDAH